MLLIVNNSNENTDIVNYIKTKKRLASKLNTNYKMTQELKKKIRKIGVDFINVKSRDEMVKVLNERKGEIKGIIMGGSILNYTDKLCVCSINNNMVALNSFNVPILGICFGFQSVIFGFGGLIGKLDKKQYGFKKTIIDNETPLFKGLDKYQKFKYFNGDYAEEAPPNFKIIANTNNGIIQGVENSEKKIYGVQFHPEVSNESGEKILKNFMEICKIKVNQ